MGVSSEILVRARQFRPAWRLFNLAHYRQLRGNAHQYERFGIEGGVLGPVSHRHGGKAIETPGATRKSLVAHYFGEGVLCYHEATERPALISR